MDQTTRFWQLSPDWPHGGFTCFGRFATSAVRDSDPEPPAKLNPENPTTEANRAENAVTIQNKAPVAVAANPRVDSALDKLGMPPRQAQGR